MLSDPTKGRVSVLVGDITRLEVDVIVNAANSSLLGGGGVDGAIHRAAGPGMLHECRLLGGCDTGHAKRTGGHALPAKHVIHTVGPVYRDGNHGESEVLRSCYCESLCIAKQIGCASIAFPCISTGIFGYPKRLACEVACESVLDWIKAESLPELVVFCCFDRENAALYHSLLAQPSRFAP